MKTTKFLLLGVAASVFALNAGQNLWAGNGTTQLDKIMQNQALTHSPRMIEQFPVLARVNVASTADASQPNISAGQFAKVVKNQALAHSPRMIEQYPALARSGQVTPASDSNASTSSTELARVMQNQSLAHSPRMLERFPELARRNGGHETTVESAVIAPLK